MNSSQPSSSLSASKEEKNRQQRPGRACDTCRRRKVRCEGGQAATEEGDADQACTLCVAQGIPCTYEQRTTKRGPPKGYVESLERRLEAMESLLASFAGKESRVPPSDISTPTSPNRERTTLPNGPHEDSDDGALFPASIAATPGSSTSAAASGTTGLDAMDELSLRLDDLVVEQNRYVGRGSGIHLMTSMQKYAQPSEPSVLATAATPSTVEVLLREEHNLRHRFDVPLPEPQLAQKLIDAAFTEYQVRWVMPRAFFDDCVNKGMIESDPTFKGLYFAILALGSRSVPNTMDPARAPNETRIVEGWTWFKASMAASGSPLESATLFNLMRIAVLAAWQLGACGFVLAWALNGWGVRQAIDVGAHCEDRADWIASPLRNQLRKRAFVSLVALDYYLSSALGRPFAIQEDDWDVTPPLSISDDDLLEWDRQTHLARINGQPLPLQPPSLEPTLPGSSAVPVQSGGYPWASIMSLHSIIAEIQKSLYGLRRDKTLKGTREAVRNLDSKLNAWLENVPVHVRWNPGQQDDEALLLSASIYSAYYSSQITVHREFISPSRSNALGFPSLAICSNAARSCAHVLDTLRQRKILYRAYSYAPVTAVSNASILLLGRFASSDPNAQLTPSAAADVKRCINVLHDLAPTTFLALRCYEGIVKLASLVSTPPSARSSTSLSSSTSSAHKRSIPSEWADGQSPAASQSDRPSPASNPDNGVSGGNGADGSAHKQRKVNSSTSAPCPAMPLPLSTSDLSAETFKGRRTFAVEGSAPARTSDSISTMDSVNRGTASFGGGNFATSTPATAYPNLYPATSLGDSSSPSDYPSSDPTLPSAANFNDLLQHSNALYGVHDPLSSSTAFDPNLATPLANTNPLDFDLGSTDFFSFTTPENHIPPDVGQAAADLWQSFSSMTPMNLEDPNLVLGSASTAQSNWTANFGLQDLSVPVGGGGGGGASSEARNVPSSSYNPFPSHWNFAIPANTTTASPELDPNNQWNFYDPNTFGSST